MAIQQNDLITRQDIVDKFNTRVRDFVSGLVTIYGSTRLTSTNRVWNGTPASPIDRATNTDEFRVTVVLDATANQVAGNSGATISELSAIESLAASNFTVEIGAGKDISGHIVKIIRDTLKLYSRIHRVNFVNSGNLLFGINGGSQVYQQYQGIAITNRIPVSQSALMDTEMTTKVDQLDVEAGALVSASNLDSFIEQCRTIWQTRCTPSIIDTFAFNYCHSNCHTNYICYNSRGRR